MSDRLSREQLREKYVWTEGEVQVVEVGPAAKEYLERQERERERADGEGE